MDSIKLNQIEAVISVCTGQLLAAYLREVIEYARELEGKYEMSVSLQTDVAEQYQKLQEINARLVQENDELNRLVEYLREQLGLKNKELYGSSSEKREHPPFQTDTPSVEDSPVKEAQTGCDEKEKTPVPPKQRKKYTPRAEKYDNLAVLSCYGWDAQRINDKYGDDWSFVQWESHKQIEYIPACSYIKETMIPVIAVGPERRLVRLDFEGCIIPRSELSASLAASLIVEKYQWHIPMNRLAERFKSGGLHLSRQNLTGKLHLISEQFLELPVEHMVKKLLKTDYIQADETPVEVLGNDEKESRKGYLWTYVSSEVAENSFKIAIFNFDWSRSGDVPKKFLNLDEIMDEDRKITLTHDGYSAYTRLEKEYPGTLNGSCCLTHFRRYWYEALEILDDSLKRNKTELDLSETIEYRVMNLIGEIFSYDTPSKSLSKEERLEVRQRYIHPLMDEMFGLIKKEAEKMAENPSGYGEYLKKAITYSVNREKELYAFLYDPQIPIDNSLAERCIRPVKLGVRNWNFFGSDRGAANAGICYTLIETAKMNGADPRIYLQYVIERMVKINQMEISQVEEQDLMEELMPWSDQYREYEEQERFRIPPLDKLVFPNQKTGQKDSGFPAIITREPEMRKKYRVKQSKSGR